MNRDPLSLFDQRSYLNLETFRQNGTGVKTPLWFARIGDALYIRTGHDSWKVKRLRRQPQVRVTPSDARGKPLGPWLDARAVMVTDAAQVLAVEQDFNRKYGWQKRLFEWMGRLRGGMDYGTVRIDLNKKEVSA